jgi:hexokinase
MNFNEFLDKHQLRASKIDMSGLVDSFLSEMIKGLEGQVSSLRMIPTYIEADNEFQTDLPVLAIDAGGTNFRTSLIKFNVKGELEFGDINNFKMPGIEKEISSEEFFSAIGNYIKALAEKSQRIGFCFSYPTEILPDKDGILLQFCKEVKAPEVVGKRIGQSLLEELKTPEKSIVLLNDTVATLLAGKSASYGRKYDSYIGYILGTGTNTCYIEKNQNILKNNQLNPEKSQIINIESGNFGLAPRTDLDISYDQTTTNPGQYTFEKMFSGGYFGGLCLSVLKTAAKEGVFSPEASEKLQKIKDLSSEEANAYLIGLKSEGNILSTCFTNNKDITSAKEIINTLIDRASKLVAGNLSAVILKTDKGKSPDKPILITIEGTTFYKLHNLRSRFENYMSEFLNGEQKRYVEFTDVAQSSLIGAALAALID